jgi:hypothetical protein
LDSDLMQRIEVSMYVHGEQRSFPSVTFSK